MKRRLEQQDGPRPDRGEVTAATLVAVGVVCVLVATGLAALACHLMSYPGRLATCATICAALGCALLSIAAAVCFHGSRAD